MKITTEQILEGTYGASYIFWTFRLLYLENVMIL